MGFIKDATSAHACFTSRKDLEAEAEAETNAGPIVHREADECGVLDRFWSVPGPYTDTF